MDAVIHAARVVLLKHGFSPVDRIRCVNEDDFKLFYRDLAVG